MAWYDKGKVPEWRIIIDRNYNVESLLLNKDLIMQELPKVEELQLFVKNNRNYIVDDLMQFCLQPPPEGSSYDRKYSHPTKAIEVMTNDFFFTSLSMEKKLVQRYVHLLFAHFLSVDSHAQNINLYHAYFQRLMRMLVGCRSIDKLDVAAAFEEEQTKNNILDKLYKHSHKLSVACSLEIMLTLDFVEPLVSASLQFKKSIVEHVFTVIAMYASKELEPQKTQNCLQIIKSFFERGINFMASKRNETETPLTTIKVQTFFGIYSIFQLNFQCIINLITSNSESGIKIMAFQLLQLNQILLSQPQSKNKQIPSNWSLSQSHSLISFMLNNRISIVYPVFIDWLTITFADIGQNQAQIDLLCKMKVLETVTTMMLTNRFNNILNAKIFHFLKIIIHNVAEGQVIACIERNKSLPNPIPITFKLLPYFLQNLLVLQQAVKQFRSINQPLFVTLFTLFKIISQYCRNIDSIFSLYAHVEICQASKTAIQRVIDFQRQEQCFMVFQREIGKDLGRFYSDDMFVNQKPIQFTVKPLSAPIQKQNPTLLMTSPFQAQSIIKIQPSTPSSTSLPSISSTMTPSSLPFQEKKKDITITYQSKSQSTLPLSSQTLQQPSICISIISQRQNEQDSFSQSSKNSANNFGSFMRDRLREVQANLPARKSKSKTPTKIKNELKKAKNKWTVNYETQHQQKSPFSSQVKAKSSKSISSPKLTKALINCSVEKIALIKINKMKFPRQHKERMITSQQDGRLLGWLTALRA